MEKFAETLGVLFGTIIGMMLVYIIPMIIITPFILYVKWVWSW